MVQPALTDTLQEARTLVSAKLRDGIICPCCGQEAKAQARGISSQAGTILVLLHHAFPVGALVSIDIFLAHLQPLELSVELLKSSGWKTLKYWGLLEEVEPSPEVLKSIREVRGKTRKPTLCKLTDRGLAFTQQGASVYKTLFTFEDKLVGWDKDAMVTILDVVGAEPFSKLMATAVADFGRVA